jgi:hypothetical protein
MTISWLTCINNAARLPCLYLTLRLFSHLRRGSQGLFFCAVNKRRHTASLLREGRSFVLNVPVQGMEELVLAVGGCTYTLITI